MKSLKIDERTDRPISLPEDTASKPELAPEVAQALSWIKNGILRVNGWNLIDLTPSAREAYRLYCSEKNICQRCQSTVRTTDKQERICACSGSSGC